MFFLNLTSVEFFALLGTLASLVTALYLLDRARRRRVVSTLQFWSTEAASDRHQARRKMRDPWSLLLQLASLLLLLLAVSDFEWGVNGRGGHDHILLLDTSSWSAARPVDATGETTVLQREKEEAIRYCSLLAANDRVMVVAADSLATPLTQLTHDRRELSAAINGAESDYGSLNLRTALAFARQAQSWSEHLPGEIVYTGPALTDGNENSSQLPDRLLLVAANRENAGIRQFSVEPSADRSDAYHALVQLKNYGERPRSFPLTVRFGDSTFAPRPISLAPGGEATAEYTFTTRGEGTLSVQIPANDSLAMDDTASLTLPKADPLRVAVYTDRPEILKPLLAADRELGSFFQIPARYVPHPPADIVVLDRFAPATLPVLPSLWIDPPANKSPLSVKGSETNAFITWTQNRALAAALHAKALRAPAVKTYQRFEGDETVATAGGEPAVVLRSAGRNRGSMAIMGFDPAAGALRFEVATPLLFASLLEELSPLAFRSNMFSAQEVGLADIPLNREEQHGSLRVTRQDGSALPFTKHAADLQIFVQKPETVSVVSQERERTIELRLPSVASHLLNTQGPALGMPGLAGFVPSPVTLWKWFALAAVGCLLLEWFLFGPGRGSRRMRPVSANSPVETSARSKREQELVAK